MDLKYGPSLSDEMEKDAIVIQYLNDRDIAKEFYAAMCNMRWRKIETAPPDEQIIDRLKGVDRHIWSCSWRSAGGIIADIRNANYNTTEDYMDYYCSGSEGNVTYIVEECFNRMGWEACPWKDK